MNRSMMMGLVTGGILGATVGMYAITNKNPKGRRKAMKQTKRMLTRATNIMGMF